MSLRILSLLVLLTVGGVTSADDKKPLQRIAFGSCVHQDRAQPVWDTIVRHKPDLWLMLGDNIYADTQDIALMRAKYAKLQAQPGYKRLLALCPQMATWDDHDYGGDDAGADYPKKKESQQAFLDFLNVPKGSPRRTQEGVYEARVFGPPGKRVQVILLDTRYHRSALKKDLKRPRNLGQYAPNTDPDATMLGAAQWKWLGEQLRVPAEVRLLCSSIQVVPEDHGFEKWTNIPAERAKLYQLIRDTKAAGVIVLSGDRHLAELSLSPDAIDYPLYDLTSSGLNQANKRFRPLEVNRRRVATMDRGDNFGLVRIDWAKEDPLITLEIRDDEGEITIREKVPLSRLQPRTSRKMASGDLAAEARKHLGKEWTVEMVVQATGASKARGLVFLNSEKDFRSERNLTIVVDLKGLAKELAAAKIGDPGKHYLGKKIRVTGVVSEFRDSPQIEIKKLDQLRIIE